MRAITNSRVAILITFFFHGAIFGNWVTRIPDVKQRLNLSDGQLGLLLLAISSGLIMSINFSGGLIARYSSAKITLVASLVGVSILPFLGFLPTFSAMWLMMFAYGVAMTYMDVAMNAQAVIVERKYGKPIMSSFHGSYSIGGFAGALYGGMMIDFHQPAEIHFLSVSVIVASCMMILSRYFVNDPKVAQQEQPPIFKIPPMTLLPLGVIALISSVGEGAMADWTAIFLIKYQQVTESQATYGFAAFSLTMTIGRLVGDRITRKVSPIQILQVNGLIAMSGLSLAVFSNYFVVTIIGFALVGLGLSVIIPIVFTRAGNMPEFQSGVGIASVASIGYLGFLAGPPLIGFIAQHISLRFAFMILAILMTGIILIASRLEKINLNE